MSIEAGAFERSEAPAFLYSEKGNDMNDLRIAMKNAPECTREPPEPVKCTVYDRCKGCTYPAHGFVCWGKDGNCLRQMLFKEDKDGAG